MPTTAPRSVPCSTGSTGRWSRSPPTARSIARTSTTTVAFLARGSDLLPDGWERMDERRVNRGNIGAVGRIVAGGKGADAPLVHAGTGSGIGGSVSGWAAGAGAAQDRLDAGRGG